MKEKYYVNKLAQPNGDHEVHKDSCRYMPQWGNAVYAGEHTNCVTAVAATKKA